MKEWKNELIDDYCVIDGVKPPFISTKLNKEIGTFMLLEYYEECLNKGLINKEEAWDLLIYKRNYMYGEEK